MSWIARFARAETGMEPTGFIGLIGLRRRDVLEASPETQDRLAAVTGIARSAIGEGAFRSAGDNRHEYRGQRFQSGFAPRMRTTFCPACLLDDARPDGPGRGRRVGRINWLLSPVRTCPVHGAALVRTPATSPAGPFQDMEVVAPDDAALRDLAARAVRREVSPLQTYVETRLDGGAGPAWLDAQDIEQASKTCEMLGAALLSDVNARVLALSEDDLDAAGAAGFAFAARGEEGVREALAILLRRFRDSGAKGGRQAAFGLIHHWLESRGGGQPKGPVQHVVREFVLDNMAVEPGTVVCGETVRTRRRHSVASLARRTRLHPKTLNRALVTGGVLPEGDPDRVDGFLSFDAAAGEALAERVLRAVPVARIPEFLNCNRTQAEALARAGLLGGTGARTSRSGTVLDMAATVDLIAFMDRFRASGTQVRLAGDGMVNVIAAARISRWPVIDIVRLVLDGGLEKVELIDPERKFRSVLVDPEEVRRVLDARQARGRLTIAEAAARLNLRPGRIRALMPARDRDGDLFLTAFTETNANGAPRHFFEPSDLDQHAAAHADLQDIAKERGIFPKTLRARLAADGIEPILPSTKLGRHVYRRADL